MKACKKDSVNCLICHNSIGVFLYSNVFSLPDKMAVFATIKGKIISLVRAQKFPHVGAKQHFRDIPIAW